MIGLGTEQRKKKDLQLIEEETSHIKPELRLRVSETRSGVKGAV